MVCVRGVRAWCVVRGACVEVMVVCKYFNVDELVISKRTKTEHARGRCLWGCNSSRCGSKLCVSRRMCMCGLVCVQCLVVCGSRCLCGL